MASTTKAIDLPVEDPNVDHVSAVVHRPANPSGLAVLLAPGAGGTFETPGLVGLCDVIAKGGHTAVRVNLPYRQAGRKGTPRAERTIGPYREVAKAAAKAIEAKKGWVLGGKSYGGRVATLAVAEGLKCKGLLCYGYPLHPPGKHEKLRVEHWPRVHVPVLIVQGTRDTFGGPDEFEVHLGKFPRRTTMVAVEGGDHSCRVPAKHSPDGRARSEAAALATYARPIVDWLDALA